MKRLFAMLLILILALGCAPALAEEDAEQLPADRSLARMGMTLAAMTAADAIDRLEAGEDDPDGLLARVAGLPFAAPDGIMVAQLGDAGASDARKGLGVESNQALPAALAALLRGQADGEVFAPEPLDPYGCVANGVVAMAFDGAMLVACEGSSALVLGGEGTDALTAADVEAQIRALGVEDVAIRAYEAEDYEAMGLGASWNGTAYIESLRGCLCASPARFEALFPRLIHSASIDSGDARGLLRDYLWSVETPLQAKAVAEAILPDMLEIYGFATAFDLAQNYGNAIEAPRATETAYEGFEPLDTGADRAFAPGDTFLFVLRRTLPSREVEGEYEAPFTTLDYYSEALLPPEAIPESVQDADYVIFVDIVWGPEHYETNGNTLIYPNAHVTIHDAATGERVRDLGTRLRELQGVAVVTSSVSYYPAMRDQVFELLQPVLDEIATP